MRGRAGMLGSSIIPKVDKVEMVAVCPDATYVVVNWDASVIAASYVSHTQEATSTSIA